MRGFGALRALRMTWGALAVLLGLRRNVGLSPWHYVVVAWKRGVLILFVERESAFCRLLETSQSEVKRLRRIVKENDRRAHSFLDELERLRKQVRPHKTRAGCMCLGQGASKFEESQDVVSSSTQPS